MRYAQKDNGMYVLSRNDIEEIATEILQKYAPATIDYPQPITTKAFLEQDLGLIVKYKYICDFQSGILGLTVMGDEVPVPSYDELFRPVVLEETFGTVLISPQLLSRENRPRRRYTEMHEAAHFILHQPYFAKSEKACAGRSEYPNVFVACRKIELPNNYRPYSETDWLEYQADALAAALLMPQKAFTVCVSSMLHKHDIRTHYLCYDARYDLKKAHSIIYDVAAAFEVSYQAAKIRMLHLGLLREPKHTF